MPFSIKLMSSPVLYRAAQGSFQSHISSSWMIAVYTKATHSMTVPDIELCCRPHFGVGLTNLPLPLSVVGLLGQRCTCHHR